MSRSGYSQDLDQWDLIRWRGAVASAIRGRRGQAFLRELAGVLDAMPERRLIGSDLVKDGEVCTLGAIAVARNVDLGDIDLEGDWDFQHHDILATRLGIAPALVQEIEHENDEGWYGSETPEQRWVRMRAWVGRELRDAD